MSTKTVSTSSIDISFPCLLTILFIGLKLTGYIDWSWWWVLSPLWLPLAVILGGCAAMGLFALLLFGIVAVVEAVFG